jgi:hypothetical protein
MSTTRVVNSVAQQRGALESPRAAGHADTNARVGLLPRPAPICGSSAGSRLYFIAHLPVMVWIGRQTRCVATSVASSVHGPSSSRSRLAGDKCSRSSPDLDASRRHPRVQDLRIGVHPTGRERMPLGANDEVVALLVRRAQVEQSCCAIGFSLDPPMSLVV